MSELHHYGVPGMKWGKRRGKSSSGGSGKKNKEDISKISDTELRQRINRIQMERQYAQLNQPTINKGRKIAQDLVANAAKQIAAEAVKNAMSSAIKVAMTAAKDASKKN